MSTKYIKYAAWKLERSGFTDIEIVTEDEMGADILVTAKSGARVCVKCVDTDKPVTANTVNEAYQAKKAYGCAAAMVLTNSTFTEKAEEFAGKAKVMLKPGIVAPSEKVVSPEKNVMSSPKETSKNIKNTKICKYCRSSIDKKVKICPVCNQKVKKPFYSRPGFVTLAVLFVVGCIAVGGGDGTSSDDGATNNSVTFADSSSKNEVAVKMLDLSDYSAVDVRDLYDYGQYMAGVNVVTVAEVYTNSNSEIKVKFDDNDSFYYNIVFDFEDKGAKNINKGDVLAIAGTVESNPSASVTSAVTLKNCSIVGIGGLPEDAMTKNDIADSAAVVLEYKQIADEKAAEEQASKEAEEAQSKADYIASCETLPYTDIARTPAQYEGKAAKVSGTVIQVQETTILGTTSVVLRVDAGNDNIWYITYSRPEGESRILEDDWITCYGECQGVESYTSILGAQITIPSMKMKYYD